MTSYRTTMREALEEMYQSLNEDNLDLMRKAAGGAKQTLKMKDGKIGVDSFSASAIMQIYDKINDKNKKTFENMMKNGKKADIVKLMKFAMSKVNASYEEFEEEFGLDEGTKQVLAHGGKGKYKVTKDGDKIEIKFGGKVVGTADFDRGADSFFVSIKGEKGQKSFDDAQAIADYFAKNKITEEAELDEAKYDLYHKDFSSAMQHAYKMAKKLHGITVDPKEIDDKVATGPSKPSEGKTNKYRLKGDKGAIQVQVYNKGGSKPFELNMYKEEVELGEDTVILDLEDDDKRLMSNIKKMGIKVKKVSNEPGDGYAEYSLTGSKSNLEKANKKLKLVDDDIMSFKEEVEESKTTIPMSRKAGQSVKKGQVPKGMYGSAARDARRAMGRDPDMKQRAFSKDVSSTDDDEKAASKNIMMQLRKAVSLRSYDVEFADGKKQKVNQKIAQAVQNKYNSMRRPADKEKFQAQIAKSYKDMLKTIKSGYGEQKESILEKIDRKIKENKNG